MTTSNMNNSATVAIDSGELNLDELAAVSGGNSAVREGVKFVITELLSKAVDAAIEAIKDAGPAPTTNHGSVYGSHPDGFVG